MMHEQAIITLLLSIAAGLHAASYGAYKDSPHESFIKRRFVRELIIAFVIGIIFSLLQVWKSENYLIIYLSTFTIARIVTEFYKLNLRVEQQDKFRIPTQIHFFRKVVQNRLFRILLGFVIPVVVLTVYYISLRLPDSLSIHQKGIIIGLLIGLADASGGAYKDGLIEGFYLNKFLKSATLGPLGGFMISFMTSNPLFLLLGTIAFMRMFIELFFKILCETYVPGKFKSLKPLFPGWSKKRKIFLIPYSITWGIFLILIF